MNKTAFTLSEILITLGIIGVVAAITMPSLIKNYQKQVTVSRLKQTYSILSQAVKLSEIQNGAIDTWNIPNVNWGEDTYNYGKSFAEKYLIPYLRVIKFCNYRSDDCMPKDAYLLSGELDEYRIGSLNSTYNFVLSNGVVVGIWPRGNLVEFYIDINGKNKPNTIGKDEFDILLIKNKNVSAAFGKFTREGIYLYGQGYDRDYLKTKGLPCAKSGNLAGGYCGALIMLDGWKIAPDYPW